LTEEGWAKDLMRNDVSSTTAEATENKESPMDSLKKGKG
jgi:hypothetical protein